jgi:hypothetical protein
MKPDEFEQQLQNQPLRAAPPAWRAEILRQAKASAAADARRLSSQSAIRNPQTAIPQTLLTLAATRSWWREWLWPCPQAWAGLATVWMILLGLLLTDPSLSSSLTAQARPPTPEARMALAAQRREMIRLLDGPVEPASIPKRAVPGPRSERMSPSKA